MVINVELLVQFFFFFEEKKKNRINSEEFYSEEMTFQFNTFLHNFTVATVVNVSLY